MMTLVIIALAMLFGVLFGLMAIVPALLGDGAEPQAPDTLVQLGPRRTVAADEDHRPAA